jgi:hypothetical protein
MNISNNTTRHYTAYLSIHVTQSSLNYLLTIFFNKFNISIIKVRKMIKAQLKFNFSPTFLLRFLKKIDVEEKENLKLEREKEI